jgi:pilus assembly protein TadC
MIALCAGVGAYRVGRLLGRRGSLLTTGLTIAVVVEPVLGVACAAVVVASTRWHIAAAATRRQRLADGDVALFADLVVLGVRAGLSLRSSIEEAGRHVVDELRLEASQLVDAMDAVGVAQALSGAAGRLGELGRVTAAAALSGAPLAAAVGAHASALRHTEHTAAVERARRLPVRMLLPLALLILPGFVVLAVGPAVLQSLARLGPIP